MTLSRITLFLCPECNETVKELPSLKQQVKQQHELLQKRLEDVQKTCENKSSEMHESLLQLENKLEAPDSTKQVIEQLKSKISKDNNSVQEIRTELLTLKDKVEAMGTEKKGQTYAEIVALKTKIGDLQEQVNKSKATTSAAKPIWEPAVNEIQERERRAANVLVFGINETEADSRETRIAKEKETVMNLLKRVSPNIDPTRIRLHRLGQYDQNKKRPIKVIFPTKEEAYQILRNKDTLDGDGKYIKYDQTTAQRQYLKQTLEELEERQKNGEQNLKIKYINSVPRIIKQREIQSNNQNRNEASSQNRNDASSQNREIAPTQNPKN